MREALEASRRNRLEAARVSLESPEVLAAPVVRVAVSFGRTVTAEEAIALASRERVDVRALAWGVATPYGYTQGEVGVPWDGEQSIGLSDALSQYQLFLQHQSDSVEGQMRQALELGEASLIARAEAESAIHATMGESFAASGLPVIGLVGITTGKEAATLALSNPALTVHAAVGDCDPTPVPPLEYVDAYVAGTDRYPKLSPEGASLLPRIQKSNS